MPTWPPITEPELLERLAMGDGEFVQYMHRLLSALPSRTYGTGVLTRALGYPWERPAGSFLLEDGEVRPLAAMTREGRGEVIGRLSSDEGGRSPVLAIGSNGSPEALELKFAHFDDEADRTVLVLSGHLDDFDVGAAAQPALYGAMPATIFPSPGTKARAAALWVTPAQFTQLAWSELSYRLGSLRSRFEADEEGLGFDEVLVFASRFGTFCVDAEPVAMAAIPAVGRRATALSQEELLEAAAILCLGPGAGAEALVRAVFEDMAGLLPTLSTALWPKGRPLDSALWIRFSPGRGG